MAEVKIFVGYDYSEERAYSVVSKSIKRRASIPVRIIPLRQDVLRMMGLYWRKRDPLASTEFSLTRFLVPALMGYKGTALFVDIDFLFLADIAELFAYRDPAFAVQVVKHDYQPTETTKMDGAVQTVYPKKNWSSLMLLNCGHPSCRVLSLETVNKESGSFLHQFKWCSEQEVGSLPEAWNVLENHTQCDNPKAIHYTNGVPSIHSGTFQYEDLWLAEERA